MRMKIQILEAEDKASQTTGKAFVRFRTAIGWMSCFDTALATDIKKCLGQTLDCEVIEKGNFKNITKVYPLDTQQQDEPVEVVKIPAVEKKANSHTTMYVSYCKDLMVAGMTIENAINAVQRLKKAFD